MYDDPEIKIQELNKIDEVLGKGGISTMNEKQKQKIMADWKALAEPILLDLNKKFRHAKVKVSEVVDEGDLCDKYGEKFSFHIGNLKNKMVEIYLELVSSEEFEGEFLGWNVKLSAIGLGGTLGPEYAPENYTAKCWTSDWDEIKKRMDFIKEISEDFVSEVLNFRRNM